jgi:hypothetical protein
MRLPVLISSCVSLAITSLLGKNAEFSESRTLPPLKLLAADLDTILHKAHASIASANGPEDDQGYARESVKLGVRGHEIEIPHFSLAGSVAFPRELFKFAYIYKRPGKPISSVTIDLSDYSRRVSVAGKAPDQVETISKSLENDLLRHSTPIGGVTFRRIVGLFLTVVLLASLGGSGAYWWRTRACNALGMLICSTVALLLVLLVPWTRYLPGFVLYQSYSPFLLIRYASEISFLSLAVAVFGIPLSYLLLRSRRKV